MADPGGFLGFRGTPLFVVLRACVAGLVCAHERSRKRSGQWNPPFQNPTEHPRLSNYTLSYSSPTKAGLFLNCLTRLGRSSSEGCLEGRGREPTLEWSSLSSLRFFSWMSLPLVSMPTLPCLSSLYSRSKFLKSPEDRSTILPILY